MTIPSDADLARIETRVNDPNETGLTPYWRLTIPTLVAALREARKALRELWASYSPEDYLEGEDAD